MSGIEGNKIFAAVLVAGITAMLGGFIAEHLVHPHVLEKDAIAIVGTAQAASGVVKARGPEPVLALIAGGDVVRGKKLSKACAACHSFNEGGSARIGPNLWNIVNRKKANVAGFSYSSAMVETGGTWGYDSLNGFLWKPKKYLAGTKMNYIGLKKPNDRAAMIAWLRTLSNSPAALPSAAAIASEAVEDAAE